MLEIQILAGVIVKLKQAVKSFGSLVFKDYLGIKEVLFESLWGLRLFWLIVLVD